jgi:carboxypeptidase Taq
VFWEFWFPKLQEQFPDNLADISLDTFYRGINTIGPNLIRTEADELHYHLHVIVRYEIERACMNGDIDAKDLPAVWNEKYKEYLNVDVPSDADGILQDVHWSHGSFGYFPTYTLGSFYAAQFFHTAENTVTGMAENARHGDYSDLLNWLRTNIHVHGRKYDPQELCTRITGEPLNVKYFMDYAKKKFRHVYES